MTKRKLLIEKYNNIIELHSIEKEISVLHKKLNSLKDRRYYLKTRICDINYDLKHTNRKEPLLEPRYT
jgi:cell division protein FtsB